MCGRLACLRTMAVNGILGSDEYCQKCSYVKKGVNSNDNTYEKPRFYESTPYAYIPSYNLCPSQVVPVLVHKDLIQDASLDTKFAIIPMRWGLLPLDDSKSNYHLFNARLETLKSAPIYKTEWEKNHRCVILCNGYFEWQAKGKIKQPFYISQELMTTCTTDECKDGEKNLVLKLAGLFSKKIDNEGMVKYSCSIITKDADKSLSSIHNRMPIILQTFEDIEKWIDCENYSKNYGYDFIQNYGETDLHKNEMYTIKYHAVDRKYVNNVHFKGQECILPLKTLKRQMTLDNWCSKRGPAAKSQQ